MILDLCKYPGPLEEDYWIERAYTEGYIFERYLSDGDISVYFNNSRKERIGTMVGINVRATSITIEIQPLAPGGYTAALKHAIRPREVFSALQSEFHNDFGSVEIRWTPMSASANDFPF